MKKKVSNEKVITDGRRKY